MSQNQRLSRRAFMRAAAFASAGLLGACTPKVVKETVVVEKVVKETVVSEKVVKEAVEVEKEVTRVVEKVATSGAEQRETADIRLHLRQGSHVSVCFVERKDYLEERFPYLNLEIEEIPGGRSAYWPKLKTMIAARTIGDLINGPPSHFDYYGLCHKGSLMELDPLVEARQFDMGQYYSGAVEDCRLDGKLYGLPYDVNSGHSLVGYNKSLFDQAGIDYPTEDWTIQGFTETAMKISELTMDGGSVWGFDHDTGLSYVQILMRMFGGDLYAPDGKTCTLASEQGLAMAKWLHDLRYVHQCTPTPDKQETGWGDAYSSMGRMGFVFQHYMLLTTWPSRIGDKFEQGITLMPKTPDGHIPSEYRSDAMSITTNSKEGETAWEVMEYYTSYEYGVMKVLGGCSSPGARPDCWDDRRIKDAIAGHDMAKKAMDQSQPFYKIWNFRGQEFETTLKQSFAPLFEGTMTPEQWVDETTDSLQKVLDKPR